ncbi:polyketide synthase-like Pks10 [Catellatospora sp. TT07R-123]|uniref:type III polyketide synthase n=1 Tax=Catellatospora sp. TT07R-123 TaxID=2733863 RepID=UPI001B07A7B2|nr:type III polyketide synthase [Catellatospora sp. TT07R-123]GHJ48448.1 polyketide synthase-like Pks10 [Catellatospora sp. TT07R-123]
MSDVDVRAPQVASVAVRFPAHRYRQEDIVAEFAQLCLPASHPSREAFARFGRNTGVRTRHLALPLDSYADITGFTQANDHFIEVALELGEAALRGALDAAGVDAAEVDLIATTSVTGLAVPSLEARLAQRVGLRPDVKRLPLFGLGCVAGAAGVARLHDYLRAWPGHTAVLLAVELCSLTLQQEDTTAANLVATSLFGDGAAAVVLVGGDRPLPGPGRPRVLATRSRLYPDTEQVMGWRIGSSGFRIVLSTEVAPIAERYLGDDVRGFLAEFGLSPADVGTWVCHPGGPKVIDTVQRVLDLPAAALEPTRMSLAARGNLSSVSVLDVLHAGLADPPPPGTPGLMIAMGPGFCSELVLLEW